VQAGSHTQPGQRQHMIAARMGSSVSLVNKERGL
jgi:hypothetical protein